MKEDIDVDYRDGLCCIKEIDFPTSCPHCDITMVPMFHYAASNEASNDLEQNVGVLFSCSAPDCGKFFTCQYKMDAQGNLSRIELPYTALVGYHLPENLKIISPEFFKLYDEASKSEKFNLRNGAGMVYRKALEILVKDFAKLRNPDKENDIEGKPLGQVISDYFGDFPRIQTLAKASAWIGNDETHYVRKHKEYDIEDLKNFLNAAALFISADEMVDQANELINKPK